MRATAAMLAGSVLGGILVPAHGHLRASRGRRAGRLGSVMLWVVTVVVVLSTTFPWYSQYLF